MLVKKETGGLLEFAFLESKLIYGSFEDIESAIEARKKAEEKYFKPILEKYDKAD